MSSKRGELKMLPAEITIQLDDKAIHSHIQKKLDAAIQNSLWFVDVNKLSELICMPKRTMEDLILSDTRMKAIERRKSQKRYYPAKEAFEVISEIMNDW